jgi:hypothetical protein
MPVAVGLYFIKEFICFYLFSSFNQSEYTTTSTSDTKINISRRILKITDVPETIKRQAM